LTNVFVFLFDLVMNVYDFLKEKKNYERYTKDMY
jgi:hypothetical protein